MRSLAEVLLGCVAVIILRQSSERCEGAVGWESDVKCGNLASNGRYQLRLKEVSKTQILLLSAETEVEPCHGIPLIDRSEADEVRCLQLSKVTCSTHSQ